MSATSIGKVEEVDLRTIWSNEQSDFTPWLAEHLDELGQKLGIDLQLIEAEGAIGTFAADIIADGGDGLVVIENQLERTDHGHLGQLLTYTAGRDARTLIWIALDFRPEHRAAIDWLNRWTAKEISAYGVVVRAVRVGDSPPAPMFVEVASPRNSRRTKTGGGATKEREVDRWLLQSLTADPDGYVVIDDVWKALSTAFGYDRDGNIQGLSRNALAKRVKVLIPELPKATQRRAYNRKRGWHGWRLSLP